MTGKKILLLNVLILAGVLISAKQLVSGWQRFEGERNLEQVMSESLSRSGAQVEEFASLDRADDLQHDFFVISERDLFRPERRAEVFDEAEAEAQQAPQFEKRPKMNGVTERGGERVAFLTTYESKKDPGKMEEVALGQMVQDYVVSEITDTTLTLTWNDHHEVINMLASESSAPPAKGPAKIAALNIIRIGSKVAAVETTTSEAAAEEKKGLQVGVVGGQAARGSTGRAGLSGRGMTGRGGSAGGNLGRSNRGGLPSSTGGFGGSRQAVPNQRRNY